MKENNRGITLLVLSVTIIIILIITSTATYYSISAYNNARLTKFENELKIMQTQVELWEEEGKLDIGEEITEEQKEFLKGEIGVPEEICEYYRYISDNTLKENGIDGIEQDYFVIIDTSKISDENLKYRVISVKGLEYKGTKYYALFQLEQNSLISSTYSVTEVVASLQNKSTEQVSMFSTVQKAVNAAGTTFSKITLLKNIENEEIIIEKGQEIVLDTNEKTLNSSYDQTIFNSGTLNITGNGMVTCSGKYGIKNQGTLLMKEGEITGNYHGIYNYNTGYVTIEGGKITGKYDGIQNYGSGNVTIKGGTIQGIKYAGLVNYDSGNVLITGGTIIGNTTDGIDNYSKGTLEIGDNNQFETDSPLIIGNRYGIYTIPDDNYDSEKVGTGVCKSSETTFNFYAGVIKARNTPTIFAAISNKPTGYTPSTTDTIDSEGYYSTTLVSE